MKPKVLGRSLRYNYPTVTCQTPLTAVGPSDMLVDRVTAVLSLLTYGSCCDFHHYIHALDYLEVQDLRVGME